MYEEEPHSFKEKIKDVFFNHHGRFSRETFLITFIGLMLFSVITSPFLYKLCNLFLPKFLIILLAIAYVVYIIYATIVICIKRLHDLNMTGWISILALAYPLNLLFFAYLCIKQGDDKNNKYGEPLNYVGPSFLLYGCYTLFGLFAVGTGISLFYATKLGNISNTGAGVQKMINVLPEQAREELKDNPRAMGGVFVDNQLVSVAVPITQDRVLIRGVHVKLTINIALREGKKVEVRFTDDSVANMTKILVFDDSASVQMAVFEIDKPIGTPAKLGERNRSLLEKMNAYK